MADTLRAIFPGRPLAELQSALSAANGDVSRAADILLAPPPPPPQSAIDRQAGSEALGGHAPVVYDTGNAIADRARARQLEADEVMARALQYEEERAPQSVAAEVQQALPSLESISQAVRPVVEGVVGGARAAAGVVAGMFEELVGGEERRGDDGAQREVLARRRAAVAARDEEESRVVTGGGGPASGGSGLGLARRRIDGVSGSGDKKRE